MWAAPSRQEGLGLTCLHGDRRPRPLACVPRGRAMGRRTCLPVLAKHQVSVVQGCCTPHVRPFLTIVGHVEGDPALGVEGGPEARAQLCWTTTENHPNPDYLMTRLINFLKAILGQATVSPFMEELQDWLEPE